MFLRRVDPNILARERRELVEAVRPEAVTVRVGDCVEAGVFYGWARSDSKRSGKALILSTREFAAELQEEVLRWVPAASIRPIDTGRAEASGGVPRDTRRGPLK